ncbi:hypothetical protein [Kangiella sp. TOML190]|uniref:hypothetical protein n=1 Tax=Kangiella sp. TOML190 TaxID=2931351 RepID=UPI00203C7C47|nr:hypothetical protein [Kangiella sp. TOML190]
MACQTGMPPSKTPIAKATANNHHGTFKLDKNQKAEICPELTAGQTLTFDFKASLPVLFNFHYHQD